MAHLSRLSGPGNSTLGTCEDTGNFTLGVYEPRKLNV